MIVDLPALPYGSNFVVEPYHLNIFYYNGEKPMVKKEKASKYDKEETWKAFLAPLLAWLAKFKPKTPQDHDRVENANYQMKRGNNNPTARQNIVKSLKLEFDDLSFAEWKSVRMDKEILKAMKTGAKDNRQAHIAFHNSSLIKPTKSIDGVTYELTDSQYADLMEASDLRALKSRFKGTGSMTGTYGVLPDES